MTVEEIIAAANNGDVEAAYALGVFFEESEYKDKYDRALPWFEKAAFAGSHAGLLKALIIRKAKADTAKQFGEWDEMKEHVMNTLALCNIVLKAEKSEFDYDEFMFVDKKFRYACYLVALERYIHNDYKSACHRLDGIEEEPTLLMKVLRGCAVFDNALETESLTGVVLKSVIDDLCCLEYSTEVFADDIDSADEYLIASGAFYLSQILRKAPINDTTRAYNLLTRMLEYLTKEQSRNMITEELKHYQQKLFGGIQYVN